ncbi:MAG: dihydrodipicolinate synthase family protein [Gemmatimonadaceae bacterium]
MRDSHANLRLGCVIPAHPLALTASRKLDERRQRALSRYYFDAGAGGLAVGVHTTQFAIREPKHGLYEPVLALAMETVRASLAAHSRPFTMVAGVIGDTAQAVREATTAVALGYDVALLSLAALPDATTDELIAHCRAVAEVMPLFGFYLQPAVGGRVLDYEFWCRFAEIERVWAVKIAPFDRYATFETVRAIVESRRTDIALYTGNDDSIVADLVTPFPANIGGVEKARWIDGGLLGQWAVGTHRAVVLLSRARAGRGAADVGLMSEGAALTDFNGAMFDARNRFAGSIAGIHEVLRRQGLLEGIWCLDPDEGLSPGQSEEIDRVVRTHHFLLDDAFIAARIDEWMK